MKKSYFFLAGLLVLGQNFNGLEASSLPSYPGHEKPSCLAQPHPFETSDAYKKGEKEALAALEKPYTAPESVWNPEILAKRSSLRTTLKAFQEGKMGQSARKIKVAGKTPQALHEELMGMGFKHKRLPLSAYGKEKGNRQYWLRNGEKTTNPKDSNVVPLDVYFHSDGTLIRVKPEGTPSPKSLRPQPSATKAVVYKASPNDFDLRYGNEAFKVSEEGIPLPKGPSSKTGFRFPLDRKAIHKMPHPEEGRDILKGWITTIMSQAHGDLAADFSQCPKEKAEKDKQKATAQ